AEEVPVGEVESPPAPKAPSATTPPESEDWSPDLINVRGMVATDRGEPIAHRPVALVDAEERRDTVTDEAGRFAILDVAPPYDLAIGSEGLATVFLGLRRADPYVELFERDGPSPAVPAQTVRVGVRTALCERPESDSCAVTVLTISSTG